MIPHNRPSTGPEESQAIADVISSGWIASGEKVKQFEQAFADCVGAKYAIAVNSGTAALLIALHILGFDHQGYNIILPTYSCAALLNACRMADVHCEIKDIHKNDFNINYSIKPDSHDDADAIIVVHAFGVPAEIKDTKYRRPYVIEDCSQALGSYINGKHVGLQGDIGIFSFGPSKIITTGSGGMIVTNNKDLADGARDFIDYDKHIPAFNFAMNDMQAAMGIEQLKKLPEFLRKRKEMAFRYIDMCIRKGWNFHHGIKVDNNWYRFVIIGNFADRLKQHLADNGITAIVPIKQDELLHNMVGLDKANFPVAEWVSTHSISLPIYPELLENGFEQILQALRSF
jgi:perosamine synthetase